MSVVDNIKRFFKRSKYIVAGDSLNKILDHPKITVSNSEYKRIRNNLEYFSSTFPDVEYLNSTGDKKTRKLNHLPIAKTACKKIASLVFNERAVISTEDEKANEFLQSVLLGDGFNKNFERYLESGLALGGLAMRPYFNGEKIKIAFIQAPVFLPLDSNTQEVTSAVIITKTVKNINGERLYYTLFEFHKWHDAEYVINNELFVSRNANLVGTRTVLSDLYDDLEDTVTLHDLSRPLFTYLKMPGMNNRDINSPLGLSIFDNAKTTIDFINRTYDEYMWEIKMGQRRVAVPESIVGGQISRVNGEMVFKQRFDPDQNVFIQFGGMDNDKVTDLTTPIRSDDYIKAINKGLSLFEMQIGVSSGMFSFDGKSMKTATEIVSENSDTYQMRNSIVSLVEHSIKELCVTICELGKTYKIYSGKLPTLEDISVNLDDGVFTDRTAELEYWTKALASGLVSTTYAMQKVLGITEEEAQDMLATIHNEVQPEIDSLDETVYGAYDEDTQ